MRQRMNLVTVMVVAGLFATGADARAQTDTSGLHASLDGWAERMWVTVLDRDAAAGGRASSAGILQRFHARIDDEQELDLTSARFGLTEDYAWYRTPNGLRYWGGSISPAEMVDGLDIRSRAAIGSGWAMIGLVNVDREPQVDRTLFRIGFERTWERGWRLGFSGTLLPYKPSADLSVGGGWHGTGADVQVVVTILDAFNDLIYGTLTVPGGLFPLAYDYDRHPVAFGGRVELPAGVLRLEAQGTVMRPAIVRAYSFAVADSGFRQRETFGYAAVLLEWTPLPRVRLGALARYVGSGLDRVSLTGGVPDDDFDLSQVTTDVGGFALVWLGRGWSVESRLEWESRPERRHYRGGAAPDVDYLDQAWVGQVHARHSARGFLFEAGIDGDARTVVRGEGEVPAAAPFVIRNYRFRADFGWRFGPMAWFLVGGGFDLDGDFHYGGRRFDGARTRIVLTW